MLKNLRERSKLWNNWTKYTVSFAIVLTIIAALVALVVFNMYFAKTYLYVLEEGIKLPPPIVLGIILLAFQFCILLLLRAGIEIVKLAIFGLD